MPSLLCPLAGGKFSLVAEKSGPVLCALNRRLAGASTLNHSGLEAGVFGEPFGDGPGLMCGEVVAD